MAMMPLGTPHSSRSSLAVSCSEHARCAPAGCKVSAAPCSVRAKAAFAFARAACSRSARPGAVSTTAVQLVGIALSAEPPSMLQRRLTPQLCSSFAKTSTAFSWPLSISAPEWPPGRPSRTTRRQPAAAAFSSAAENVRSARTPPAHEVSSVPSSSESTLISMLPLRGDRSSAAAPSMPISSSTVKTTSRFGWRSVSLSRIERGSRRRCAAAGRRA